MEYTMTLTNKRIHDFYKKNPGLDFESMNLVLLGFLEHLSQDMTALMQNTAQGQLLQEGGGQRERGVVPAAGK